MTASAVEKANLSSSASSSTTWVTRTSFAQVCRVVGTSFAGSPTCDPEPGLSWSFRGIFPTDHDDPDRLRAYEFIMGFPLAQHFRQGAWYFGHPAVQDDTTTKNPAMSSCVVVREFDPVLEFHTWRPWWEFTKNVVGVWQGVKAHVNKTLPKCLIDDPSVMSVVETRGQRLDAMLHGVHEQYGPSDKHWYVFNVATVPDCQGRGYGRQLLTRLNHQADVAGRACYLECASLKNKHFYEKFGYQCVHQELATDDVDQSELLFYIMVRQPQTLPEGPRTAP